MSNLKKALTKKMDIHPSSGFDAAFFEKLDRKKSSFNFFSKWITWSVTGLATASVLFITITSYNKASKHSFNHAEYVESVLDIQSSFEEDNSDFNASDLTISTSDEI